MLDDYEVNLNAVFSLLISAVFFIIIQGDVYSIVNNQPAVYFPPEVDEMT